MQLSLNAFLFFSSCVFPFSFCLLLFQSLSLCICLKDDRSVLTSFFLRSDFSYCLAFWQVNLQNHTLYPPPPPSSNSSSVHRDLLFLAHLSFLLSSQVYFCIKQQFSFSAIETKFAFLSILESTHHSLDKALSYPAKRRRSSFHNSPTDKGKKCVVWEQTKTLLCHQTF